MYQNHSLSGITKPWYDKKIWNCLSIVMHSWTAGMPVFSLDFKLKSCTLLSSLVKVKFSGELYSGIESISTILLTAWNKTNSSTPIFYSFPERIPGNGGSPQLPEEFAFFTTFYVLFFFKMIHTYD